MQKAERYGMITAIVILGMTIISQCISGNRLEAELNICKAKLRDCSAEVGRKETYLNIYRDKYNKQPTLAPVDKECCPISREY